MAYSPLLGGAYVKTDSVLPVQYQNVSSYFKLKVLHHVAEELDVSTNAVVLAWMIQSSPRVIPLVTGSSLYQIKENLQALSFTLSKEQLGELNQDITHPNKYH